MKSNLTTKARTANICLLLRRHTKRSISFVFAISLQFRLSERR